VVRLADRQGLRAYLDEQKIGAGIHYPIPIHRQPAYAGLGPGHGSLPVTEQIADEILSLPIYPELTPAQAERVVAAIHEFIHG
jgi:dTDP-4-amino-4,6-dideoxygalactose transaminase